MRLRNKSCDTGANGSYSYHPKQADWSIKDELFMWLKYQRQSSAKEVSPREGGARACLAAQSCPTLRNPRDCSPPGSSVHGIFQARTLERVAISFSWGSSQPRDRTCSPCGSCIAGRIFSTEPPWKVKSQTQFKYSPPQAAGKNQGNMSGDWFCPFPISLFTSFTALMIIIIYSFVTAR